MRKLAARQLMPCINGAQGYSHGEAVFNTKVKCCGALRTSARQRAAASAHSHTAFYGPCRGLALDSPGRNLDGTIRASNRLPSRGDRGASRLNQIGRAPRGSPARRSQVQLRIAWPSTSVARTQPRVACGLKGQSQTVSPVTICRKDPDFGNTQRCSEDATLYGSREVVTESMRKRQSRCDASYGCVGRWTRAVSRTQAVRGSCVDGIGSGQAGQSPRPISAITEIRPIGLVAINSPLSFCGRIVHSTASSGIRRRVPRAKGVLGEGILRRQAGFTLQGILPHADQQAVATIRRAVKSSKPQQSP